MAPPSLILLVPSAIPITSAAGWGVYLINVVGLFFEGFHASLAEGEAESHIDGKVQFHGPTFFRKKVLATPAAKTRAL